MKGDIEYIMEPLPGGAHIVIIILHIMDMIAKQCKDMGSKSTTDLKIHSHSKICRTNISDNVWDAAM